MKDKNCKHLFICDGGYGRKRCVACDKIIEEEEVQDETQYE